MSNAYQFRPLPAVKPDLSLPLHKDCLDGEDCLDGDECPECRSETRCWVPMCSTYEVYECTSDDCDWTFDPSDDEGDPS